MPQAPQSAGLEASLQAQERTSATTQREPPGIAQGMEQLDSATLPGECAGPLQYPAMLALGVSDRDQDALAHRSRILARQPCRAAPGCPQSPSREQLGSLLA